MSDLRPIAGELGSVRGEAEWWNDAKSRRESQTHPFVAVTLYPRQLLIETRFGLGPRLEESVSPDVHEVVWMGEERAGAYWSAPRRWLLFVVRETDELVRWKFKPGRSGAARIDGLLDVAGWDVRRSHLIEPLSIAQLEVRRWRLPP